jgi:hypothetical protein
VPVTNPQVNRYGRHSRHSHGLPLAVLATAANVHNGQFLLPMLDCVPAIRTPARRGRWRPDRLHADKAYDDRELRRQVRARGINETRP